MLRLEAPKKKSLPNIKKNGKLWIQRKKKLSFRKIPDGEMKKIAAFTFFFASSLLMFSILGSNEATAISKVSHEHEVGQMSNFAVNFTFKFLSG